MVFKVLVVDDSTFYRRRVRDILNQDSGLEVVGEARNGQEAIEMARDLSPDVITMDIEMPVLDGISAVRQIMRSNPLPILMFSSLTHEGAQATLDALEAGALDFLPKRFEDIAQSRQEATDLLKSKVKLIARRGSHLKRRATKTEQEPLSTFQSRLQARLKRTETSSSTVRPSGITSRMNALVSGQEVSATPSVSSVTRSGKRYKCLALGASTGGPVALTKVLSALPADFPYPIFIVQHMPGTFTTAFAQRLNGNCKIAVVEAENGQQIRPGTAYLAPGGMQMLIEGRGGHGSIRIREPLASDNVNYKPSVDITFDSLAPLYGGDILSVILTGMGADGKIACANLKQRGAKIWAQDQQSCVVYGMPQAVAQAGISEKSIALDSIADCILTEMFHR